MIKGSIQVSFGVEKRMKALYVLLVRSFIPFFYFFLFLSLLSLQISGRVDANEDDIEDVKTSVDDIVDDFNELRAALVLVVIPSVLLLLLLLCPLLMLCELL